MHESVPNKINTLGHSILFVALLCMAPTSGCRKQEHTETSAIEELARMLTTKPGAYVFEHGEGGEQHVVNTEKNFIVIRDSKQEVVYRGKIPINTASNAPVVQSALKAVNRIHKTIE